MVDGLGMEGTMEILLAGGAWGVRQAATGSPVWSVLGIAVDPGTAKCTVFFGTIGRPLSTQGGFRALLGGGGVSCQVCTARKFVAFVVTVLGVRCSVSTVLFGGKFCRFPTSIGSHLTG